MIDYINISDSLVIMYNIICMCLVLYLAYECYYKGKEIEFWKANYDDIRERFDTAIRDYICSSFEEMKNE